MQLFHERARSLRPGNRRFGRTRLAGLAKPAGAGQDSLADESLAPGELGLGPPVSGLCSSLRVSTSVLLERSGLGEAAAAALAAVELHSCVHLHVSLHLVGLPEPARAHGAGVRPLPSVDQQVALVVLRRLELLPTLLALVRLDARVQQLVAFQL